MKYKVGFYRNDTIIQYVTAEVECDSEGDIEECLENNEYEEIDSHEVDYYKGDDVSNIKLVN